MIDSFLRTLHLPVSFCPYNNLGINPLKPDDYGRETSTSHRRKQNTSCKYTSFRKHQTAIS